MQHKLTLSNVGRLPENLTFPGFFQAIKLVHKKFQIRLDRKKCNISFA